MLRTTKTALLAALMVAAVSTHAAAQDDPEAGDIRVDLPTRKAPVREEPQIRTRKQVGDVGPLRFYGGFNIAVGGDLKLDEDLLGVEVSPDLDPTVGLQFGADYVLHEYFSIGGETRFLWFKIDGGQSRNFLWDLDIKPRGRYAFGNIPLEVYGALPIGLTVAGIEGEGADGGAGFNVGLLAGANWFFTNHLGVNAEMGWQFHKFKVEADAGQFSGEAHWKMNQFVLLCPNFIYAL
jgi:opacity protein-like surface antigen